MRTHQAAAFGKTLAGERFDFVGRDDGLCFIARLAILHRANPKMLFDLPQGFHTAILQQIVGCQPGRRVDVVFKVFEQQGFICHRVVDSFGH